MAVADYDFGVGANVHQHHRLLLFVHPDCNKCASNIRSHVTTDYRPSVDVRLREYAEPPRLGVGFQRRSRSLAFLAFQLYLRLVWLNTNCLYVNAEGDIPHGSVAHQDYFVNLPAVDIQLAGQFADFKVDRRNYRVAQFSTVSAAVKGNSVHHVAPPEPLGILEGGSGEYLSGLQVHQIHCHGGSAYVYCQTQNSPSIGINELAPDCHLVAVAPYQRVRVYPAANTLRQDSGLTAQDGKSYGLRRVGDNGLASQPVAAGKEILIAGVGSEPFRSLFDFHDTLMATASPPAG